MSFARSSSVFLPNIVTVRLYFPAVIISKSTPWSSSARVEIRDLRKDTDRAQDREWRGNDAIGDARHQVTATGGDFIDGDGQRYFTLADPRQL